LALGQKYVGPQAAGRIVRWELSARAATARRLAKKASRRRPRSHGILAVQFSASEMVDLIQRVFLVMDLSFGQVFLLDEAKVTRQRGMSLAEKAGFSEKLPKAAGELWQGAFGNDSRSSR
jgi:hypothetical protein